MQKNISSVPSKFQVLTPPPCYKWGGGFMDPSWVFVTLQYFAKILPFVGSLWCALQHEVYNYYGLWRCWGLVPPCRISFIMRNDQKRQKLNFLCYTCRIWIIKHFTDFGCHFVPFFTEKGESEKTLNIQISWIFPCFCNKGILSE